MSKRQAGFFTVTGADCLQVVEFSHSMRFVCYLCEDKEGNPISQTFKELNHFRKISSCKGQRAWYKVNYGATLDWKGEQDANMVCGHSKEGIVNKQVSQKIFLRMDVNYDSILEQADDWTPAKKFVATNCGMF